MISSQILQLSGRLRGSTFLANMSKLLSGEMLAQIAGILALPFLTRLYPPEAFGVLGLFMAVTEVGGKCSSLRYDVALVLPDQHATAWALYSFSSVWAWFFSGICLVTTYPLRWEICQYFGFEMLAPYFFLIAAMVLAIGLQSLASFWAMRMQHFKALAEASAASAIFGNGFKLLAGVFGFGAGGLLLGTALQRWLNLLLIRLRTPSAIWVHSFERGESRRQASAYLEFPLYRLPQDILNSVSRMLPNVLMLTFFGPAIAGFYILADRVLQLPFSLLQEALRKVFYIKAIEVRQSPLTLLELSLKLSGLLCLGMVPVVLAVMLWAPLLCATFFGVEWVVTGEYARWIIIAVVCHLISLPASVLVPVMGWNRFYLIFEILSTAFRISVVTLVARSFSPQAAVMAIALTAAASGLLLFGIVLFRLFKSDSRAGTTI
ncbi:MAG: O-antigen/teichoic acid export membrane protein [Lentimonas sp.]|jgi:O-antigen/teichoic acid export membrane protein